MKSKYRITGKSFWYRGSRHGGRNMWITVISIIGDTAQVHHKYITEEVFSVNVRDLETNSEDFSLGDLLNGMDFT